jgi:hypothetical protein
LRAPWLQWLLKPLIFVLLLPILGCGGLLALLLAASAIDRIPANVMRAAREQGNLAPLPPSATDLRTDGWSNGFSSARYLRFKAKPQEIEQFLAASPGLKGVRPERFHARHMYLPYPALSSWETGKMEEELKEPVRHHYFSLHGLPEWYNPTIRIKGRRYAIPWHDKGYYGEIVVDDVDHEVFICVSYS